MGSPLRINLPFQRVVIFIKLLLLLLLLVFMMFFCSFSLLATRFPSRRFKIHNVLFKQVMDIISFEISNEQIPSLQSLVNIVSFFLRSTQFNTPSLFPMYIIFEEESII